MDNRSYIAQRLAQKHGWNSTQVDATLANLQSENASFDPTVHEDHTGGGLDEEGGYGLAQWTSPSRKEALKDFADSTGGSVDDRDTQIDFLASEIDPDLLARMGDSSPQDATEMFMKEFERPADQSQEAVAGRQANLAGSSGSELWGNTNTNSFGTTPGNETTAPTPPDTLGYMEDEFKKGWSEGVVGSTINRLMQKFDSVGEPPLNIDQDVIDRTQAALPLDANAAKWCLLNAGSEKDLNNLIAQKQAEAERDRRMAKFQGAWSAKAAGVASNFAGGIVSDPLTYVGAGAIAKGGKGALSAVMKFATGDISLFADNAVKTLGSDAVRMAWPETIGKYATAAALGAGYNVGSGAISQEMGGYKQDYETLALTGALFGGALSAIGDTLGRRAEGIRMKSILEGGVDGPIAKTMGLPAPSELAPINKLIDQYHSPALLASLNHEGANKLAESGALKVVSGYDMERLAAYTGKSPKEMSAVKAFYNPQDGSTILNRDALTPDTNIDNLLAHEAGVHGGLQRLAQSDPDAVSRLQKSVEAKMKKPNSEWLDAIRRSTTSGGGWEEVLGHYIEQNADKTTNPILKQANYVFNKARGADLMNTDEMKDFAHRSLQDAIDQRRGYQTLPDGSVIMGNLKYSSSNMMNPNNLNGIVDSFSDGRGWLSKQVEAGGVYQTPYGVLANSDVPILREFALNTLDDARMRDKRAATQILSTEKQKDFLKGQQTQHVNDFIRTRGEYIGKSGVVSPERYQDFNVAVTEAYNQKYGGMRAGGLTDKFDPAVLQAVESIKKLRDMQIDFAKRSGDMFGKPGNNMLPKEWEPLDDELWRRVDDDKWYNMANKFEASGDKTAQEVGRDFYKDYYVKYAKRDSILHGMKIEAKQSAELSRAKGPLQGSLVEDLGAKEITPEMVEERVKQNADEWSLGIADQNLSNLVVRKGQQADKLGAEGFLHNRFPLDTSGVVRTPWGEEFSFDKSLRSTNLDRILPSTVERVSGELSLHNTFADMAELKDFKARAESALDHAVAYKRMDKSTKIRQLEALNFTLDGIRGLRRFKDVGSTTALLADTLRSISYAKNGSMFGASQLGEAGGMIAESGLKSILNFCPGLANWIREAAIGRKGGADLVKNAERDLFGESMEKEMFRTDWRTRNWVEASEGASKFAWGMDKLQNAAHFTGRLTSAVSQLSRLTDIMVRGARKDAITDSIRWARGEDVGSLLRSPFSEVKLKAAGIKDVTALKDDINKYSQGKDFDMQGWMKKSPDTFMQYRNLIDNAGMRSVTQITLGNTSMLANGTPLKKFLFQFKDFTFRVMNSQVARAFTHRELDSTLALLYSMGTNAIVYAGVTGAKSLAITDEGKRKKYLHDNLTWKQIGLAALLRSTAMAAVSFGTDIYEAYTDNGTFRMSTNPQLNLNKNKREKTTEEKVGRYVEQVPGLATLNDIIKGAIGAGRVVGQTVGMRGVRTDQEDLQNIMNNMPLRNYPVMLAIQDLLKRHSGKPVKITQNRE